MVRPAGADRSARAGGPRAGRGARGACPDWAGAQSLLDQVVDRYPNSEYAEVATLNRAILAVRGGRAADTLPELGRLVNRGVVSPYVGRARAARGAALLATGKPADAERDFQAALGLGETGIAQVGLGSASFARGQWDAAARQFAAARDPPRGGVGGADRQVQSPARADPRLPAHRLHPRSGDRADRRIRDLRHRIRRLPAAADRGRLLPARRRAAAPGGLPDMPTRDARTDGQRPAGRARRARSPGPARRPGSSRSASRSSPRRRRSKPSTRRAAGSRSSRSATNRCCWKSSPRGTTCPRPRPFTKKLESEIPLVETVPGAQDASVKSIQLKVGTAMRKGGKAIFYGRLPRSCPKGFLPGQDGAHVRRPRRPDPADGHGRIQGTLPAPLSSPRTVG